MANCYSIRSAGLQDIEHITNVVLEAMPDDPQWDYRFVHKRKFPEDHRHFTSLLYKQFVDPSNDDWTVMLAEASSAQEAEPRRVVGFAVFDISLRNKATKGPDYEAQNPMAAVARLGAGERRDVAPQRQAAFKNAATNAKQRFFDGHWGDRQVHLQILGVHPSARRQGIGAALVRFGMDLAKAEAVPLTLLASPMGALLYASLGFRVMGDEVVQVPGEDEKVEIRAMVRET